MALAHDDKVRLKQLAMLELLQHEADVYCRTKGLGRDSPTVAGSPVPACGAEATTSSSQGGLDKWLSWSDLAAPAGEVGLATADSSLPQVKRSLFDRFSAVSDAAHAGITASTSELDRWAVSASASLNDVTTEVTTKTREVGAWRMSPARVIVMPLQSPRPMQLRPHS